MIWIANDGSILTDGHCESSGVFKRQLKCLSRRYRHIKQDIKPVIDASTWVVANGKSNSLCFISA